MLCLDFLNTVDAWPHPTRDDLVSADDLGRWAADTALPLSRPPTDADVAAARALRERLLHVFSTVVDGRPPAGDDVQWLLAEAAASSGSPTTAQLAAGQVQLRWSPPLSPSDLGSSIAFTAVSLLVQGPLARVKACPTCGWFFLDSSRNGTRRWCSMQYCGSRAKARTYAAHRRSARAGSSDSPG